MQIIFKFIPIILIVSFMFGQGFFGKEFPEPTAKYSPRTYVCYKTKTPIVIDGKMDESSWENTDWTQLFVYIEGNKKPDPYFETRLKMLWDEKYFYFGAILEEPHVWATLTMRDAVIFKDNDFEIFLDPDGDTHNYYELEVNAFETEWDLILIKPYHDQAKVAVDSWDIPGLITKVHVDGSLNDPSDTDKGWNLEIAIPWKALEECAPNFHPQEGEQWKVNFSRVQWDVEIIEDQYVKTDAPEHNWVWSPQGLIYMHMPELWGIVQFTQAPPEQGNVEFQESKIDQIKWALRQVYYGQRNYFFKNDRYTASLKELNLIKKPVEDVPWPPKIVLTPSGWEAVAQWTDRSILIRKDRKVWVE